MVMHDIDDKKDDEILSLTGEIVAAYVSNNPVQAGDIPAIIKNIHSALSNLSGAPVVETPTALKPAVPVKKSVTPEYLVCLEDGKKLKMLKRYLRSRYGLSPDQYRAKWNLPADYPMVASNYAAQRSEFAKKIGLGKGAQPTKPKGRK